MNTYKNNQEKNPAITVIIIKGIIRTQTFADMISCGFKRYQKKLYVQRLKILMCLPNT